MDLETVQDFEEVRSRWDRFWKHESRRPMIRGQILKPGKEPVGKPPYASGHEGDFGPVIDGILTWADAYEFVGDAIPFFYLEFAADHFSSLLGVDLEFREGQTGGWPVHCIDDPDQADIRFRPDCRWWERTAEFAEELEKHVCGNVMIAAPSLVANLDALVAMMGAQNVLMALIDKPDSVKRMLQDVTKAHGEILDAFADLFEFGIRGSINRHGFYSSGCMNVAQCDISAMIGPDMFREFALPCVKQELARYDGGEYHLDGPDAIKHLEALCELEEIDIIQWIPGAGEASSQDWTWLYDKIDSLGKGQWRGGSIEQIRDILDRTESRMLVLDIDGASRQEIEDLIAEF